MMLTGPYNIDPLKPHSDLVKLSFIGIYLFLVSAILMSTHNPFLSRNYHNFSSENCHFNSHKNPSILHGHVEVMVMYGTYLSISLPTI